MAAAAFDNVQYGVGDGLRQGDCEAKMAGTTRGQEGNARRGNATTSRHDERMREWGNKRTTKNDDATHAATR